MFSQFSKDGTTGTLKAENGRQQLLKQLQRVGRRGLLVILAAIFLILSVLIIVAHELSLKQNGLIVLNLKQTIFTYFPTVVLLLLTSLWRQIDHSYKNAAPWVELRKGAATANKSVLLDYISTMQIVAFPTSIRNGHAFVTLGILGFFLLKAVTIASTGLFLLQNRTIDTQEAIKVQQYFDGTLYKDWFNDLGVSFATFATLTTGPTQQFGITAESAYPTFILPKLKNLDSTFSITADAVYPLVECEAIRDLQASMTVTNEGHRFGLNYNSSMCDATSNGLYSWYPIDENQPMPFQVIVGNTADTYCYNSTTGKNEESNNPTLFLAAEFLFDEGSNGTSRTLVNSAGVVCRTSYTTGKVNVSGNAREFPNNVVVEKLPNPNGPRLPYLTNDAFHELVMNALMNGPRVIGPDSLLGHYQMIDVLSSATLRVISSYGNGTSAAVFDKEALMATAKATLTQGGVQVFNRLLRPNQTVDSTISVQQTLKVVEVTTLSTWLMVGGFLITVVIAVFLMFNDARFYAKKGTETILAMAHLSMESHSLSSLQVEMTSRSEKETKNYLIGYRFYTAFTEVQNRFGVVALSANSTAKLNASVRFLRLRKWGTSVKSAFDWLGRKISRDKAKVNPWWKQMTFSNWFLTLTFVYSVAIISVLEALQQLSDNRNGIAVVTTNNELARTVLSRYLPATVVLLLATMYNCLEFNVLLLSPYHHLRRTSTIKELQRSSPVSQFPAVSLWNAILRLDIAIVAASTAAFVGTLLTIVVSGLYTIDYVSRDQEVTFGTTGIFNTTWSNSFKSDSGATFVLGAIENLNISRPVGTYDELALPIVTLSDQDKVSSLNESSMAKVQAYVYRPELTCDILAPEDYTVAVGKTDNPDLFQNVSISARYTLPPACQKGGRQGNSSEVRFDYVFRISFDEKESYMAKLLDLHMGPYTGDYHQYYHVTPYMETVDEDWNMTYVDNPPGCPSLVLIHGFASNEQLNLANAYNNYYSVLPTDGSNARTLTVQVCYQEITRLKATLLYRGTDLTLDPTFSPDVDENSAEKLLVQSSENPTSFPYRIQAHLDTLQIFNDTANPWLGQGTSGIVAIVDDFFQAALFGHKPLPFEILKQAPSSQSDQELLQKSVVSVYRYYMVQSLSLNMRVATNSLQPAQLSEYAKDLSFPGTINNGVSDFELRFIQHKTQKIILQSMIGYMTLSGILALYLMRDMRTLIPSNQNPCTIWGSTAFWTGSRWCASGDNIQETRDEIEMRDITMRARHPFNEHQENTKRSGQTVQNAIANSDDAEAVEHELVEETDSIPQTEGTDNLIHDHTRNIQTIGNDAVGEVERFTSRESISEEAANGTEPGKSKSATNGKQNELRFRLAWWDAENCSHLVGDRQTHRYGIDVVN